MSRESYIGEQVWYKWFQDNTGKGRHIEVYPQETLADLMISRLSKMASEVAGGKRETWGRMPRVSDMDEVFQTILKAGLLQEVNPRDDAKEKAEAARRKAEAEQIKSDLRLQKHVWGLEKAGGQNMVSEFYHKYATKEQKAAFDRLFPSGAIVPESAPQQANLFIVKATSREGRTKYISSDGFAGGSVVLDGERSNAFQFGASRADRFAGLLKHQKPELDVQVIPLTQRDREPEFDAEKYAVNFMREFYPKYVAQEPR